MSNDLNRQCVLNMLVWYYDGDLERAMGCFADDVEFVTNAPIDLLPHLGVRRGKAEVREMYTAIRSRYSSMRQEFKMVIAEDDKVAVDSRVHYRKSGNNRVVQFDIAHFYTLKRGKITAVRQILDSFDLVQQVLERDVAALLTGDTPST